MSSKQNGFQEFITNSDLTKYLSDSKLSKPTQIQSSAFPALLGEGDFIVQGKTGSGKTLAYLLPVIQRLKELEALGGEEQTASPKAIVLVPTRELALQVFSVAKGISHFAKLRIRKLIGGDKGKSLDNLFRSPMDILITSPERCFRAFKKKDLSTQSLKFFVLDEADQLFDSSFKKTTQEIAHLTLNDQAQVFLVGASRPANFEEIISEAFPDRAFKTIGKGEENVLNHQVSTHNISLEEDDKFVYVNSFLKKQNKRNGLVFMGNKARAQRVYEQIKKLKKEKVYLVHKDLEIKDRLKVVEDFRKTGGVMISTDIMARGVDISHLQWVLNFDLPSEADYYLHRCGRVGRSARAGDVFNFITSRDNKRLMKINESLTVQGREDIQIPLHFKRR